MLTREKVEFALILGAVIFASAGCLFYIFTAPRKPSRAQQTKMWAERIDDIQWRIDTGQIAASVGEKWLLEAKFQQWLLLGPHHMWWAPYPYYR